MSAIALAISCIYFYEFSTLRCDILGFWFMANGPIECQNAFCVIADNSLMLIKSVDAVYVCETDTFYGCISLKNGLSKGGLMS